MNPWATFQQARDRQRRLMEEAARYRLSRAGRPRHRPRRVRWFQPALQVIDLIPPEEERDLDSEGSVCRSLPTSAPVSVSPSLRTSPTASVR